MIEQQSQQGESQDLKAEGFVLEQQISSASLDHRFKSGFIDYDIELSFWTVTLIKALDCSLGLAVLKEG